MKKKLKNGVGMSDFFKVLKIMRLSAFFLLFFVFQTWASSSYSQQAHVTLNLKNVKLLDVLNEIENVTNYYFLFNKDLVNVNREVSVSANQKKIGEVLDNLFAGTNVKFVVSDRQIVLTTESYSQNQIQQMNVKGKVTDSEGQPLPGVSVVVKGTTTGTITDFDGKYSLDNVPVDATLVFSFVGMRSQEIKAAGKSTINIQLEEETIGIEEVVAVGYGTQRRDLVTSAIGSVKINESNLRVSSLSPSQLLQGRIAGVTMSLGTGNLGSRERVSIRGASSLSAGNEPLYVVDGIPITNPNGNLINYGDPMSSLSALNLSDIESIDVLKDAASAAIYGSRATNGVVIITTKSGKEGKTELKVNFNTGFSQFPNKNKVKYSDSKLHIEQYNEGVDNYNRQYGYKIGDANYVTYMSNPHPTIPDFNWLDFVTQTGMQYNADVSFSAGTKNTRSYISVSYNNQEGIIKTNSIEKIGLNAKISHDMASWLEVGTQVTGSYYRNHQVPGVTHGGTVLGRAVQKRPFDLPYKPNGEYFVGGTPELAYHNPIQMMNETKNHTDNYRYLGSLYAILKYKNLVSFKTSLYPDISYTYDYAYYTKDHPYGLGVGRLYDNSRFIYNTTLDNVLNYNQIFGKFDVSAMIGHSFQKITSRVTSMEVNGFPSPAFDVVSVASTIANYNGSISEFAMESYFSRAMLSYSGKYILNASIRTDGSSKFDPEVRWGIFPSVAFRWNIAKEKFFTLKETDLNLRFSYGKTGNQEGIGNYTHLPLMGGGINYGGAAGIAVTSFGNDKLTWETATQYNAGFDLSLKGGKINVIVDVYQKNTNDLLYTKPVPATTGRTSETTNVGSMLNRGIDFALNTYATVGRVKWNSQFNIAFNKNKLTSLLGDDLIAIGDNRALKVGEDIGIFYLFKMEGIYQYDGEVPNPQYNTGVRAGDVKWRDVDGNGIINDNDRILMGSSNPEFTGGWGNTFIYKNFHLDIFSTYTYGNDVYAQWKQTSLARIGDYTGSLADVVSKRWTGPGSTNKYPRAVNGSARSGFSTQNSDRFLEDGSFFRIRTITLSYIVPTPMVQRLKMKSLRVYCQADNVLLFTPYSGYDPEVSKNLDPTKYGVDEFSVPAPRTFSVGINVGL